MRLGYKAHEIVTMPWEGQTSWQAGYRSGGTYKVLKLQGDGAGGGRVVIHGLEGRFRAEGNFYMTGDNYKVWAAGSFQGGGEGDSFIKGKRRAGGRCDPGVTQVSLRYVGHLPDDDVAPLGFAQCRFHL